MTTTDVDNWPGGHHGLQGPELMTQLREHGERLGVTGVLDQIEAVDLGSRPLQPARRFPGLHLRRADHRHRRIGPLPRPALRAELSRQGRVGLRHLRRLLLQGPARRRDRRRQHRRRGSAVPVQPGCPTSRWCTAATSCAPRRCSRTSCSAGPAPAATCRSSGITRWKRCSATTPASPACACAPTDGGADGRTLDVTGAVHRHRPRSQHGPLQGPARTGQGLHRGAHGPRRWRNRDQRPGRLRRGRRRRQRLPAGHHLRRLGLHGGAGCGKVPGQRWRVNADGRVAVRIEVARSIADVAAADWNGLARHGIPVPAARVPPGPGGDGLRGARDRLDALPPPASRRRRPAARRDAPLQQDEFLR